MKKILLCILWLTSAIGICSCLDDKNDYNYSTINELDGKIENLDVAYGVSVDEELTLAPTFKFKIDKEALDIAYEWRINGKLLPEKTDATCTFTFAESGAYEVTFTVVDNETGMKFSAATIVTVRSLYLRGWLILSEGDNHESQLSFIGGQSIKYQLTVPGEPEPISRDSLIYGNLVERNLVSDLGNNPVGLFENAGYTDDYGEIFDVSDEVVVMQDKWVELNGKTLERSVYTEQEFKGELPEAGFNPVAAAMTYSAKALLNSDGYIYWANNSFVDDFHTCIYTAIPLNNKQKFSGIYPSFKLNGNHAAIPACTQEDNSIVGILDLGRIKYGGGTSIHENSIRLSSTVTYVTEKDGGTPHFTNLGNKKVVTIVPASYDPLIYNGATIAPGWVALLKTPDNQYELRYFVWDINTYVPVIIPEESSYVEAPIGAFADYKDIAVFNNKQYIVIADGSDLWYFQYGASKTLKKLKSFTSPIRSIAAHDINHYSSVISMREQSGHLAVALEDGTFWIYAVKEKKELISNAIGACAEVSVDQLFPDPKAQELVNNNFGKIVDVIYKLGNVWEFTSFDF